VKTLALFLLTAPIGYLVLSGYLLGRVRPVPIGLLSSALDYEEGDLRLPLS
jgi:hypothetical protein